MCHKSRFLEPGSTWRDQESSRESNVSHILSSGYASFRVTAFNSLYSTQNLVEPSCLTKNKKENPMRSTSVITSRSNEHIFNLVVRDVSTWWCHAARNLTNRERCDAGPYWFFPNREGHEKTHPDTVGEVPPNPFSACNGLSKWASFKLNKRRTTVPCTPRQRSVHYSQYGQLPYCFGLALLELALLLVHPVGKISTLSPQYQLPKQPFRLLSYALLLVDKR